MAAPKPVVFWADSIEKLRSFPREVRIDVGHALTLVEQGGVPPSFDHLPELGAGVMEIKTSFSGDTYRAFYVARFPEAIYVLDTLQKKSKRGKSLPREDRRRIAQRYRDVMAHRATL
jgi:phage-related protein